MTDRLDHELLDAGGGRRLERFGPRIVDRPAPGATGPPRDPAAWERADLRYRRGRGWTVRPDIDRDDALAPWTIAVGPLVLEVRPAASGQLGVFPEHASLAAWVGREVATRAGSPDRDPVGDPVRVLNLFAHTGLLTLVAVRAGALPTHVDASRPAVTQARRNALLSGLADRPVRWIVDDALAFTRREARRGITYDGVILDPPAYGHAARTAWRLRDRLPEMLAAAAGVARDDAFVLLTTHSSGIDGRELATSLSRASGRRLADIAIGDLALVGRSGARLAAGWFARSAGPSAAAGAVTET